MKKLRLDVEQMEVESFDIDYGREGGTVVGHHVPTHTCDMQCGDTVRTCNQELTCLLWDTCYESGCGYETCDYTCHSCPPTCIHDDTCGASCDYTCGYSCEPCGPRDQEP